MNKEQEKLVALAKEIALEAHFGQERKDGGPYYKHSERVVGTVRRLLEESWLAEMVSWLHDVLEDCKDWTSERLLERGITQEVVTYVEWLTEPKKDCSKRRFQRKWEYLEQLKKVPTIVKFIKLADRLDNISDVTHLDANFQLLYAMETVWLLDSLSIKPADGYCFEILELELEIRDAIQEVFKRVGYEVVGKR